MSLPICKQAVVDIRALAAKHHIIANDRLAIHGISRTDTVASLHGIDKATVLKTIMKGD